MLSFADAGVELVDAGVVRADGAQGFQERPGLLFQIKQVWSFGEIMSTVLVQKRDNMRA